MSVVAELPEHSILNSVPPTLAGDMGGWTASLTFLVASADRTAFLITAAGTAVEINPGYFRIIPLQHPEFPEMLAMNLRAEDFGQSLGHVYPLKSHSKITVDFATVPYTIAGDAPFMTTRIRYSGQYVTLPGSAFKLPSDNTPIKQDAGVFVPEIGYSVTLYQCQSLGDDVIADLVGKVNNGVFLGRDIGTVRFDGAEAEITQTISFQNTYTRTLAVTYRPRPWNEILRPNGVWEAPINRSSGVPMYLPADLTPLLA